MLLFLAELLSAYSATWPIGETDSAVLTAVRLLKMDTSTLIPGLPGHLGPGFAVLLWTVLGVELNRRLLFDTILAGQLGREKRHTIVCGLGEIGMQLVRDLHKKKRRIVVVERDANNRYLDDARELGVLVLVGDATDDETMKEVHPERASELFAVAGRDASNMALSALAVATIGKTGREKLPLHCFAHIDSSQLAQASREVTGINELTGSIVEFILPQKLAATHVLTGPVFKPMPADLNGRTPHFVLFGFGIQGQALAMQIGELMHLENEKRCRVTILFEEAKEVEEFRSMVPAIRT